MNSASNDQPVESTPNDETVEVYNKAYENEPIDILREIETRHEIKSMLLAGLSVATVYSLLVYQAKILLLTHAAMPYASGDDDFHPIVGLMNQSHQLKNRIGSNTLFGSEHYQNLTDTQLVDNDLAAEEATQEVIALLSAGWVDAEDVHGFNPKHPVGPDFSFAEELATITGDALDYLPAELLLAEIGKIVVPALADMAKRLDEEE